MFGTSLPLAHACELFFRAYSPICYCCVVYTLQMVEKLLDPEGEYLEYFENTLSMLGYMSYVTTTLCIVPQCLVGFTS